MAPHEDEQAIAAFIRQRGVTRCPTACVLPTRAEISAADRAALEQHALNREMRRDKSPVPPYPAPRRRRRAAERADDDGLWSGSLAVLEIV